MSDEFEKEKPERLSGKDAIHAATDAAKYPPVKIEECEEPGEQANSSSSEGERLPALADQPNAPEVGRKAPPRVRKPSAMNDRFLAPTTDLQSYHARLREAFGNTMSDEFVQVMLGKLVEALRPGPYDELQETTLNAALAMVSSAECRSELEAFLLVEIVATGFSGLRLLRQSQKHMTEDYINIYGNYGTKLIRLQLDLMKTFEQMRRVNQQTVAVGRLDIHPGAQALVGIVNKTEAGQNDKRPHASGRYPTPPFEYGQSPPVRRQDPWRRSVQASRCPRPEALSNARRCQRLGRSQGPAEWQFQERALDAREH